MILASTIKEFIEALEIIAKYSPNGLDEAYFLESEHDTISSHIDTNTVSWESLDGQRLEELGWHVNMDTWMYFT